MWGSYRACPLRTRRATPTGRRSLNSSSRRSEPQVPQLVLALPETAPKGTIVSKRDGLLLSSISLGIALPVDPGEHVIVTQVPSGPEHEQRISVPRRGGEARGVGDRAAEGCCEAAARQHRHRYRGRTMRRAPHPAGLPGHRPSRTWAYVAGGIGVAGTRGRHGHGVDVDEQEEDGRGQLRTGLCAMNRGCRPADDGKTLGNISTVGFGVGVAGLATGVVLWLAAPKAKTRESVGRTWHPTVFAGSSANVGWIAWCVVRIGAGPMMRRAAQLAWIATAGLGCNSLLDYAKRLQS